MTVPTHQALMNNAGDDPSTPPEQPVPPPPAPEVPDPGPTEVPQPDPSPTPGEAPPLRA